MASLNITSTQFQSVMQNIQSRYVKLELLNYQYQTVDSIEGVCTSGSISIDANSDIRRTGSIELVVNSSSFEVSPGNKVWLDKYIRVWIGIMSFVTGEVEYTNCGLFIISFLLELLFLRQTHLYPVRDQACHHISKECFSRSSGLFRHLVSLF